MLPSRRRRNGGRMQRQFRVSFDRLSSLLYMSWETEFFNNFLFNWGVRYSRYLKPWFGIGIGFGLISMTLSVFVMLSQVPNLSSKLGGGQATDGYIKDKQTVTLVVPGVNVPWSDLPYMISATAFAVGFHELGHALAAASEGVCIEHVAIFLACLVPGAFVALNEDGLEKLSPIQALRIYSAGIWQNILLCSICHLFMLLLPLLLFPFYLHCESPVVSSIDSNSPLKGYLKPGDSILEARGVKVRSIVDWVELLHFDDLKDSSSTDDTFQLNKLFKGLPSGPPNYISTQGYCVPRKHLTTQGNMIHDPICLNDTVLFYQISMESIGLNLSQRIFCLKATDLVEQQACSIGKSTCLDQNRSCVSPILSQGEALIDIKFKQLASECESTNASCHQSLLYIGEPEALFYSLKLTEYRPRQLYSDFILLSLFRSFPDVVMRLLTYTFSISAAMVLLNSAPVFYLDGESMVRAWIQISLTFCNIYIHPNKQKKIIQVSLIIGSIVCVLFLASGVINMVL